MKLARVLQFGGLAFVLLCAIIYPWLRNQFFSYDDAYMFIRYAHNLDEYNVFGWNQGDPSYGCTSIGYVFSTFVLIKLGFLRFLSISTLALAHSYFYYLSAITFCYLSVRVMPLKNLLSRFVAILCCLAVVVPFSKHITGMDTLMAVTFNFVLLWICFSTKNEERKKAMFIIAAFSYLSILVRPDNLIYASLFPFLYLIAGKEKPRHIALFCLSLLLLLGIHCVLLYFYFGDIFPIPYYVKADDFFEAYIGIWKWNSISYLTNILIWTFPFTALLIYGCFSNKRMLVLPYIIPTVITSIVLVEKVQIMGFDSRYFIPSIPFIICGGVMGFKILLEQFKLNVPQIARLSVTFISAIALIVVLQKRSKSIYNSKKEKVLSMVQQYDLKIDNDFQKVSRKEQFSYMNELISEIGDENFVIGASEHGLISALNLDTRILCMAGLHNLNVLEEKSFNTKAISSSLLNYNPDLLWLPHSDYVALRHKLLINTVFIELYDYYPGVLNFGIAIKKDSPYSRRIKMFFIKKYDIENMIPVSYSH